MSTDEQVLYTATKCGHRTHKNGEISAFERSTTMKMSLNKEDSVDYCLDCICNMTIQCVRCGKAIFIHDAIALYSFGDEADIPKYAIEFKGKFVGCLNADCAEKGTGLGGFWKIGKEGTGVVLEAPDVRGEFFKVRARELQSHRPVKPLMTRF